MKVDIYGSRSHLMNITNLKSIFDIEVINAYIGTTIDSQVQKSIAVDEERLEDFISNYELLEIKTDLQKRFRRFNSFSRSKVILIDFMGEGQNLIKFNEGTLVKRPVIKRYGLEYKEGKEISYVNKITKANDRLDTFLSYLETYDLIILNKMRNPKYTLNVHSNLVLKKDIEHINFMNFHSETLEDLLLQKRKDIEVIPEYLPIDELRDGYMLEKDFNNHLKKHLDRILNS